MGKVTKSPSRGQRFFFLAIPLFIGIFTFFYWIVFFPLLWKAISDGVTKFWFNVICLCVFLFWLFVISLCLCCMCYNNKRFAPVSDAKSTDVEADSNFDGPNYETRSSKVQPFSRSEMCLSSKARLDAEQKGLAMHSIPVQPQNTPSLYNLYTGRQSYETEVDTSSQSSRQVVTQRKNADSIQSVDKMKEASKFKSISLSDSDPDMTSTKQGITAIHGRTEVGEYPDTVLLSSDSDEEMSKSILHYVDSRQVKEDDDRGSVFRFPDRASLPPGRTRSEGLLEQDAETFSSNMENYTPDALKLSQNLPEFDDYLHIVEVEPPLSPREIFFIDLIRQADENEGSSLQLRESGNRRSYCGGKSPLEQLKHDNRKSVPLYMYSDKWRNDDQSEQTGVFHEENVDSDEDSGQIEQVTKPDSARLRVVSVSPKRLKMDDNRAVDMKTMTEIMLSEERRQSCLQRDRKRLDSDQGVTNRSMPRDFEEVDVGYKPSFFGKKPLKLSLDEQSPTMKQLGRQFSVDIESEKPDSTEPMRSKPGSESAYFIANVTRPKSISSEVYLTIDDTGLKVTRPVEWELQPAEQIREAVSQEEEGVGKWHILDKKEMKQELEVVCPFEDDNVFEEVQASLGKLRHKH